MQLIPDIEVSARRVPAEVAVPPATRHAPHRRVPGLRLTILLDDSGARGRLAAEIARLARANGLPAVGVFRGVGALVPDTGAYDRPVNRHPIMVTIVGDPEPVEDLLVGIVPFLRFGDLTVEDVQIVAPEPAHQAGRGTPAPPRDRAPVPVT